jgi:rod shape-determining protein MreC
MQSKQMSLSKTDPFNEMVGFVVLPVSAQLSRAADSCADFAEGVSGARALAEKNKALQGVAQAAAMYEERLENLGREIDSLRKMIGLPEVKGREKVPAEVIALIPSDYRITISAGHSEGVRPGMPVVTGEGLVGVVQSVAAKTSQVTLISSPYIRIGAITMRDPPSAGLLRGESSEMSVIEFLDFKAPVENGDWIVTSGFSERIPRGIPIGRVVQLENSQEFGTRRSRVFPFVHIGAVREVFVLR